MVAIAKPKTVALKSPKEGLPELTVGVVMVPASAAAEFLTKNVNNRRPKKKHIKELKGSIVRGEWELNAQPVIFDSAGNLLDGQNRLMAIVEAGELGPEEGVPLLIVWGVDPKSFHTIDQHAARTAKDTIYVASRKTLSKTFKDNPAAQDAFSGLVASAARMIWGVREENRFVPSGKLTNRQVQNELDALSKTKNVAVTVHAAIAEVVQANLHKGVSSHISLQTFGGLYTMMANDDHDVAKEFLAEFSFDKSVKPADDETTPKIVVSKVVARLQKYLRTNRTDKTFSRSAIPEMIAAAWNAYKADEDQAFTFKATPPGEERFHIGGKLDPVREPEVEEAEEELEESAA